MPTKDNEKIKTAVYIDGKPVDGVRELALTEINMEKESNIDKFRKLINFISIFVLFIKVKFLVLTAKHRKRGR